MGRFDSLIGSDPLLSHPCKRSRRVLVRGARALCVWQNRTQLTPPQRETQRLGVAKCDVTASALKRRQSPGSAIAMSSVNLKILSLAAEGELRL